MAASKRRSLWWTVHSWAGLKVSLFMTFVLATGTLAIFSKEMDWLANPAMRVVPRAEAPLSWGALAGSAAAAVPGGHVVSIYAPPHAWFAAMAVVETGAGEYLRVYLDPATGAIQGTGGWVTFQIFFRQIHRHLMLPVAYGVPIVTSMALLLLLSLVTGLVSYKKFWRGFFRRPRGGGRRLAGELHRLAGLWSLWFVALVAATGAWYLVESLGGEPPQGKPPDGMEATVRGAATPTLDSARIDGLVVLARAAYPMLDVRELRFPAKPDRPIAFMGQADALLVRDQASAVWVDPGAGRVLRIDRGETLSTHRRVAEMADPLHFGTWGGMATRLVWFLFGAMLTGMAVTGAMIYSLRLDTARREAEAGMAARHGPFGRWVRRMGAWGYVAAALILLSFAMTPFTLFG